MRSLTSLSAVAVVAFATAALSQPLPPLENPNRVLSSAPTDEAPSPDRIRGRTPAAAVGLTPTPRVTLICVIGEDGRPQDCVVDKESPEGLGLGAAALDLAPDFRFEPSIVKDYKGRRTTLPVYFGEPWRAPPPPPRYPVVTRPQWLRKPTAEEVAKVYPKAAMAAGLNGRITASCQVQADGSVTNCSIVSENPGGHGFGEAGLALMGYFRMAPKTEDGMTVSGALVRIPLAFTAPAP